MEMMKSAAKIIIKALQGCGAFCDGEGWREMEIGFCFDCKEIHYAIADSNGVYEKHNVSSNHHNCKSVMVFDAPEKYSPPIRNVLSKLQAKLPISHNEIVLFKLAMQLEYE